MAAMHPNRRSFLRTAGAGLPAWWVGRPLMAEAPPVEKVVVRQAASDRFELVFAPKTARSFKILQLTDTHFGNPDPAKPATDRRSHDEIRQLAAGLAPDFIMHTGDFIDNDVEGAAHGAFDAMHELGVPWALAPGNHDGATDSTLSPERYRERMAAGAGVMGSFDRDGKRETAYRLDIVTAGSESQTPPAATLLVFDSGPTGGTKHVSAAQLEWFQEQMEADRSRGASGPVYAMIHIPVIEFKKLKDSGRYAERCGEEICFETDTGKTFATLQHSGRVKAIFSGHDHENTFHGKWDGIELVYGRVGGWSAYGDGARGGRLVELDLASGRYQHRIVLPKT